MKVRRPPGRRRSARVSRGADDVGRRARLVLLGDARGERRRTTRWRRASAPASPARCRRRCPCGSVNAPESTSVCAPPTIGSVILLVAASIVIGCAALIADGMYVGVPTVPEAPAPYRFAVDDDRDPVAGLEDVLGRLQRDVVAVELARDDRRRVRVPAASCGWLESSVPRVTRHCGDVADELGGLERSRRCRRRCPVRVQEAPSVGHGVVVGARRAPAGARRGVGVVTPSPDARDLRRGAEVGDDARTGCSAWCRGRRRRFRTAVPERRTSLVSGRREEHAAVGLLALGRVHQRCSR